MLDDLYSTIIDEVTLVNCAKENNIVTSKMNYEDIFKEVKNDMDFITKVKDLFSIDPFDLKETILDQDNFQLVDYSGKEIEAKKVNDLIKLDKLSLGIDT